MMWKIKHRHVGFLIVKDSTYRVPDDFYPNVPMLERPWRIKGPLSEALFLEMETIRFLKAAFILRARSVSSRP